MGKRDYAKMAACTHERIDPHRDVECPDCGRIQWMSSGNASEALKQHYMFACGDALFAGIAEDTR